MENKTNIPLEVPSSIFMIPIYEKIPAQERVANPVFYQFERSMTEILSERKADSISTMIAAVFIP